MARLLIREIDDDVMERLRARAHKYGRTVEDIAHDILRNELLVDRGPQEGAGTILARRFSDFGLDFEIPELRGEEPRPAIFEDHRDRPRNRNR